MITALKLKHQSLFVKPRARRNAVIVASVPELTNLTLFIEGINLQISFANVVSNIVGAPKLVPLFKASVKAPITLGCACPAIIGPQEPT